MMRKIGYYLTHWEVWHWFAKYIVIGPAWLWLCLKGRSFWFFTPSNPTISFGGWIGESKSEIYEQLPSDKYPRSIFVSPKEEFNNILSALKLKQLSLPLAVKPDIGMMGFMFRKVDTIDQLLQYHQFMPARYIIQELIDYPLEVSVFYYRFPNKATGNITGFIRKEFMQVTGDGNKDLETLIKEYPRAAFRLKELLSKHESHLKVVVPADKPYYLSYALNLSRGGRLISLEHEKDAQLLNVFDQISNYSGNFFYGRYDIKCNSIEDLKKGKNYSILEYNGSGAEPHHVYGNGFSFLQACGILIHHWNILFKISQINRASGIKPWTFRQGLVYSASAREHFRQLKAMDTIFEFDKVHSSEQDPQANVKYVQHAALITQNA
ncbi:MAG: hypothetical protein ABI477_15055 [Chryseolinea sp.]